MSEFTPPYCKSVRMLAIYKDLWRGLRDEVDPVTWRTLVVDCRRILGSQTPDCQPAAQETLPRARRLIFPLIEGTPIEPLGPEILEAIGYDIGTKTQPDLNYLLLNGRHYPEELLFRLYDYLKAEGNRVAVVNPVGHYNDRETRIVGPASLCRHVGKLVVLASTQSDQGGSYEVLSNTLRLLRNPEFASRISGVEVVIPMFGGSRGHCLGQDEVVGYEVLEAKVNALFLALHGRDILESLAQDNAGNLPIVRFASVDVHNQEEPGGTFKKSNFDFISISPAHEFAEIISQHLREGGLTETRLTLVACDNGAIPRTEALAESLLNLNSGPADIIYLDKERLEAGVVEAAKIAKMVRWWKQDEGYKEEVISQANDDCEIPRVLILSDDMVDTCGTASKDVALMRSMFANCSYVIFVGTHAVLSQGAEKLDRIGADHIFVSNTLTPASLRSRESITVVDMAPAIGRLIMAA